MARTTLVNDTDRARAHAAQDDMEADAQAAQEYLEALRSYHASMSLGDPERTPKDSSEEFKAACIDVHYRVRGYRAPDMTPQDWARRARTVAGAARYATKALGGAK